MTLATAPKLFTAATLGGKKSPVQLKHRVVMSPMTRLRMGDDGIPGAAVVEFYSQRATDGGELFGYIIEKLNDYDLAYLHLVEPRGIQVPAPDAPEGGVLPIFRKIYNGFIITASGYDRAEAIKVVEDNSADCVAFARDFISNPDLVERLKTGAELNERNQKTVYLPLGVPFETGYTDYPFLSQSSTNK
ncbi:hypothetical protein JG687_00014552 [Phytophthora cactorum]|uniref:NADH:flavin oxidoreductase/NADH oxidase N-terminal domain-containing protein n=1 Tax=Phytophthora cactorum TaxID=29920 RepID=A0A8T1TZ26_9STRA|nr:hypothetical protein JG687_00014552 [Phytophthora cactorum]